MNLKYAPRRRTSHEYNAALIRRGSLTLWVSEEALGAWYDHARTTRRGAPRTYSDTAILCMVWLGSFNFDPRSANLNTELSFVIANPALARRRGVHEGARCAHRAFRNKSNLAL